MSQQVVNEVNPQVSSPLAVAKRRALRGRRLSSAITLIGLVVLVFGALNVTAGLWYLAVAAAGFLVAALGVALLVRVNTIAKRRRLQANAGRRSARPSKPFDFDADAAEAGADSKTAHADADADAEQEAQGADNAEEAEWTPRELPKPLEFTREEVLAAAFEEARRAEGGNLDLASVDLPGLVVPGDQPYGADHLAEVEQYPVANAGNAGNAAGIEPGAERLAQIDLSKLDAAEAAKLEQAAATPAGLAHGAEYSWLDSRTGEEQLDSAQAAEKLEEIMRNRRQVG